MGYANISGPCRWAVKIQISMTKVCSDGNCWQKWPLTLSLNVTTFPHHLKHPVCGVLTFMLYKNSQPFAPAPVEFRLFELFRQLKIIPEQFTLTHTGNNIWCAILFLIVPLCSSCWDLCHYACCCRNSLWFLLFLAVDLMEATSFDLSCIINVEFKCIWYIHSDAITLINFNY